MSRNEGGFMRHNHATPNQNKFIRPATPLGSKIAAVAVQHHQSDPAALIEPHFTQSERDQGAGHVSQHQRAHNLIHRFLNFYIGTDDSFIETASAAIHFLHEIQR